MGDSIQKRIDINISTSYSGAGVKLAEADIAKLREAANLPAMGPLTRGQALTEQKAIDQQIVDRLVQQRVQRMEEAGRSARLREAAEETLFGRPEELQKAAKARFGAEEQMIRDLMARRIRAMREEARKVNLADEVNKRLFGGDPSAAGGGGGGTILEILKKLGTSNGLDAPLEKLAKLAPMIGAALAITKAGTLVGQGITFMDDVSRHNRQGNLDRQVADEQRQEAFLRGIPIVGEAAGTIGDLPPWAANALRVIPGVGDMAADKANARYGNKVAIEELENATKAQDKHTEAMQKRLAVEGQLRDSAKANVESLRSDLSKHDVSPERAAVVDAQAALAKLRQQAYEAQGKGVDPKKIAELQDELVLRQKVVDVAQQDEARAHGRAMARIESEEVQARLQIGDQGRAAEREALRQSLDDQLQDVKNAAERAARERANIARLAAFDKETAEQRRKNLGDLEAQTADTRMRTAGFGFTADLVQLDREAKESVRNDPDPESRRLKVLKYFADEAAIRRKYHQEAEDEENAHRQKLLDTDADFAERRLKLAGKGNEAEKLELEKQRADRLEEIRAQTEQELRAHAERAPAILKRAQEDVDRANEQYQLGLDEMEARNRALFKPGELGAYSGESRLLSGVSGAAGDNSVGTHIQTIAAAAKKAEEVRQRMNDNVQTIADWIRAQTAAPAAQPVPR